MNQIDILFSAMGHFLRSSLSLSGLAVQLFQGLTGASFLAITGGGIVTSSKEILNGKYALITNFEMSEVSTKACINLRTSWTYHIFFAIA